MEVRDKNENNFSIFFFFFVLRFTHSETLSNFYCDKCQMSMSANIKLTISQAPIVACFHLKVTSKELLINSMRKNSDFRLAFSICEKISIKNA